MSNGEDRSRPGLRRAAELSVGVVLAFGFFLVVLLLLQLFFPEATGIGQLLRRQDMARRSYGPSTLGIDGVEEVPFVAVLSRVFRQVKDKQAYAVTWSSAEPGTPLAEFHSVQSFQQSGATIAFDDRNRLDVGENSLVIVRTLKNLRRRAKRHASLLMISGGLRGSLPASDDDELELELVTAGGSIRTGSHSSSAQDFNITATPDGPSVVTVYEGEAEIRWGSTTTVVPANHSVTFSETQAPGRPQRLPDRPTALFPTDGMAYLYRDAPPRVRFAWDAGDRADGYRFQLARDPRFEQIVHEETLSGNEFTHGYLRAGEYYWRVSGLREQVQGPSSPSRRLRLKLDRDPPTLRVSFPESRIGREQIMLQGTAEPGSRVLIGDEWATTEPSGYFEHTIELRRGYNVVVVQAIDSSGNTAFASGLVNAEF